MVNVDDAGAARQPAGAAGRLHAAMNRVADLSRLAA